MGTKGTQIFGRFSRASALLAGLVLATLALSLVVMFSNPKPAEAQSTPEGESNAASWGQNTYGQVGDGTTTNRSTPVQVSGLTDLKAVAGGRFHSLAVKNDGTVWAWGHNGYGQVGDGTTTNRSTPVQVSGLNDVKAVAAGGYHSLAVKNDGTVWAWGYNTEGQIGDGTNTRRYTPVQISGLSDVKGVEGGGHHSLAVKNDGTAWAWGDNGYGQVGDGTNTNRNTPVQVGGLSDVTAVEGGGYHSLAVKNDGTAWAWGYNFSGQVGDGTNTNRNTPVQVGGLTDVKAVAGGVYYSLAVKNDGTAWTWGETSRYTPVQVGGLTDVKAVAGGGWHRLAAAALDFIPPETSISDTSPSGTIASNKPTFTFSGSDNKTQTASLQYSYKVNNGTWSSYSTATSVTLGGSGGLLDGNYTFYVRARDVAANVDASPAERTFTVDTTAPRVTATTPGGTEVARNTNLTATFSENMNPDTLTKATFKLFKVNSDGTKTRIFNTAVTPSTDGLSATLDPFGTSDTLLRTNTKYKAIVTTKATDSVGNALDQNSSRSGNQSKVWTFTTGSS